MDVGYKTRKEFSAEYLEIKSLEEYQKKLDKYNVITRAILRYVMLPPSLFFLESFNRKY